VIRLLIVDDHPIVRDGLRAAFEGEPDIHVAGEAGNGREGVERAVALGVDIVLMDLRMPEMDGVTAIKALRRSHPDIKTLVLTTFDSDSDVLPAIEAGATGYLLKAERPDELFAAIHAAAEGRTALSAPVAGRVMANLRRPRPTLTDRERDILAQLARGLGNRDIARALFISEATVKTHLRRIYDKLGVDTRAGAVAVAKERRLLP